MRYFTNTIKLIITGVKVLILSIGELNSASRILGSYTDKFLSKEERKEYQDILKTVSFNCGITMPIVFEYQKLQIVLEQKSKKFAALIALTLFLEDALVDELNFDASRYDDLYKDPLNFKPEHNLENVLKSIYLDVFDLIPSDAKIRYTDILTQLHLAQNIRLDRNSRTSEIKRTVFEKGGWFPAIAIPFKWDIQEYEIRVLKHLGTWIKYVDDLVDIESDKANGRASLFTNTSIVDPDDFVEGYSMHVFKMVTKLGYTKKSVNNFIFSLRMQMIAYKNCYKLIRKLPRSWEVKERHRWILLSLIVFASFFSVPELVRFNVKG